MNVLVDTFSLLSELLLIPALVGLLAVFVASIVALGGHTVEALERRRDAKRLREVLATLREGSSEARGSILRTLFADDGYHSNLACFLATARAPGSEQAALDRVEDMIERRLARSVLLVRLGPLLGLMGTLIPMGPALTALAAGNMPDMAEQLVLAFTTTVVGLATAVVATLITTVRRRWYAADLRTIAGLHELVMEGRSNG